MSERDGQREIYVMNADGSGLTNLTHHSASDNSPAWSPDGDKIAFYSNRDGNPEIYVMNTDGSNPIQLTNNGDNYGPAWSPDGNKIAFFHDGILREWWVINADGSNPINLTISSGWDTRIAWSPDSTKIAFVSEGSTGNLREISVMNADGSDQTQLTHDELWHCCPAWSPDGKKLAYVHDIEGTPEIRVINADGSNPISLAAHAGGDRRVCAWPLAWSPDGTRIAFMSCNDRGLSAEIYVMNADGSSLTQLTTTGGSDPAWLPTLPEPTTPCADCTSGWTHLTVGSQARVSTASTTPNRVRSGPSLGNDIIAQLPPGTVVEVLDEPERLLFQRLSIFASSFSLETAEAVCSGEGIARDEVLTVLGRLVDKSLLSVEPPQPGWELPTRYRLLETIRNFGGLKLEDAGEADRMGERHADYFVQQVEAAEPELLKENQGHWYRLLLAEVDNLRAAVEWAATNGRAEAALRIVGALLWFWWSHGSSREGLNLAELALSLPAGEQSRRYRGRTLNTAAYLHWVLGDIASSRDRIEEALAILTGLEDEASLGWSMQFLGLVLTSEGKYDEADEAMLEGLTIAWKVGDLKNSSFSLAFRGDIALRRGDRSRAEEIYKESAHLFLSLKNKLFLAYPKRRLGYFALERGEFQAARELFQESLELNREGGDQRAVLATFIALAALANQLDLPGPSARLYGWVESQLEMRGINLLILDQIELNHLRAQLLARLGEPAFSAAFDEGWEMSEDQALELAGEILREADE